jgi:hypothetical protein
MNFIRRILKSYTAGTSSIDPLPAAAQYFPSKVDEHEDSEVNHQKNLSMSSISRRVESDVMVVKMEMKHEAVNGNLHDVPVFIDKLQRKAVKKQRRKDARLGKEKGRTVLEGRFSGANREESSDVQQQRTVGPNKAAVTAIIRRKRKKQAKKQRRREAAAKQVQTNIAEPEERTALYAVPYHLWCPPCEFPYCEDPNFRECPPGL